MILKGSQRGGALNLARHLLNDRDNDHVTVHSVTGFVQPDVTGALMEMYATSRATRCTQFMFSLSLSPPKGAIVTIADFENAVAQAAERLGLQDQPRVVLFHEKESRLHCHAVFSRIDVEAMKAINLPFFKERLTELSRELYLTHGWDLPKGLSDPSLADPLNYGLEEWQAAKRAKRDPREIKATLKQCWTQSDGRPALAAALKERGFWLCRGDRRGFVALDYQGNIYSLSRWLDVKPKELKARLGEPELCASIEVTKREIAASITDAGKKLADKMAHEQTEAMKPLLDQRQRAVDRQRVERQALDAAQRQQREAQALAHAQRFRRGIKGIFDWITGKRAQTRRAIEAELEDARRHFEAESEALRQRHLAERQRLLVKVEAQRRRAERQRRIMTEILHQGGTEAEISGKEVAFALTHGHEHEM